MSHTHRLTRRSARRALSLTAAGAMVFALAPMGIAHAQTSIGNADVCPPPGETEQDQFSDDDTSVHEENINCAVQYGIVQGFSDGTFRPGQNVNRAQMATFVVNQVETALGSALPAGTDAFTDDNGNVHEANINKLAAAGIVGGVGNNEYNPGGTVSRAQMATFIANAIDYHNDQSVDGDLPPAASQDFFSDDNGNVHEANINKIAAQGIVLGTGGDNYSPANPVERGQLSTFVVHTAEYADSAGLWEPTSGGAAQAFAVTPADTATLTFVANPDTNSSDDRAYSVSGLTDGTTYNIALFPSNEVVVSGSGKVTFGDNEGGAGQADDIGDTTVAQITLVNGTIIAATGQAEATPVNGQITFTIDGTATGDVTPVVYLDADNDSQIDLDANDAPTESVGVGGMTTYLPAEAAGGAIAANTAISRVSKTADYIVAGGATYFYDANDQFQIGGVPATMADFEAALSTGDELDGNTYAPNPDLQSVFNLDDLTPAGPTAVTTTALSSTSVRVDWTPEAGVDSQNVYRAATSSACDSVAMSSYNQLASLSGTANTYTDSAASAGTAYCYLVTSVVDQDESAIDAASTAAITTPAAGESVRPTITDLVLTSDATTVGFLGSGDVVTFSFSEDMADTLGSTNATYFRVSDGDSVYQIACVDQATCVLGDGPDGAVVDDELAVTLTGAPVFVSGTDNGLDLANTNTVTLVSNAWDDQAGNQLDLAGSADKVIDVE